MKDRQCCLQQYHLLEQLFKFRALIATLDGNFSFRWANQNNYRIVRSKAESALKAIQRAPRFSVKTNTPKGRPFLGIRRYFSWHHSLPGKRGSRSIKAGLHDSCNNMRPRKMLEAKKKASYHPTKICIMCRCNTKDHQRWRNMFH